MNMRLNEFIRRVAERANGSQIDHSSRCDLNAETVHQDVPVASMCALADSGSAPNVDFQSTHPVTVVANVTDVAHFFLPEQSEGVKASVTTSESSNSVALQLKESATCATEDAAGDSREDIEEEVKVIDLSFNIDASETKKLRADTEPRRRLDWTHVTAACVSLVDVESGCATDISAATRVVIFRSITEARLLGIIDSSDLLLQQAMWLAISRGYFLVLARQRVFLANPAYLLKQFQIYQPSNKD